MLVRVASVHFGEALVFTLSILPSTGGKDVSCLISKRNVSCWLSGMYSSAVIIRGTQDLHVTEKGCSVFRAALVFVLSVTSWLQNGSLTLPAQLLHPTCIDFLLPLMTFAPSQCRFIKQTRMKHYCGLSNSSWSCGRHYNGL